MGSKSSKSAKYDLNESGESGTKLPEHKFESELKEKEKQKISPLQDWLNDAKSVHDYSKKIEFKTADSAFQKFYQLCCEHVKFLERHQGTKKPNDALMKTEILAQMGIINELNSMVVKASGIEKQYLSMIEASLGLFGWFQLNSIKESQKHIKEHINASVFFLNRVKTESSDSSEKELHKNLSENWLKNLWSFHSLVLDLYPNGLWGPSSNNAANTKMSQEDANEQLPSANGKPAICKLDGKKWILENLGETTKEIDIKAEQLYAFNCIGTTLKINGKSNSITIDKCSKVKFVFNSVISQVEIINSKSIQGQVFDLCPTLTVDGSSGVTFYVSSESRSAGFQVVSSRTDSMNILMPGEESFEEIPIPEQFKTTFDKNNKSITVPVDHA